MKSTGKLPSDTFDFTSVESDTGMMETGNDLGKYNELYRELAEMIGESAARKIWKRYSGLSVTFPRKLYSQKYTRDFIAENMKSIKPRDIAVMADLSEQGMMLQRDLDLAHT